MRIIAHKETLVGIPLIEAEFGSVVTRAIAPGAAHYLVVSPMDGTGRRILVTLLAGTLKEVPQDTRVIPVPDAVLVIGARASEPREHVWSAPACRRAETGAICSCPVCL
jgi:hypothetical protein